MRFLREQIEHLFVDSSRQREGFICFLRRWLINSSRVPELPGVFGERRGPLQQAREVGLNSHARLAELDQIVCLTEGDIVPGEERLEGLLHGLLAMEGDLISERRGGRPLMVAALRSRAAFTSQDFVSAIRTGSLDIQESTLPGDRCGE